MVTDMLWATLGAAAVLVFLFLRRDRHYPIPERLTIIRNAIERGSDIRMVYFTYRIRRFTEHRVTPKKLRADEYLEAFEHRWEKIETFRICRIKELREIPSK
jgi:predicted DNA-binding transcriptional regulator YafY